MLKRSLVFIAGILTASAAWAAEPAVHPVAVSSMSPETPDACVDLSTSCLQHVNVSTPARQTSGEARQPPLAAWQQDLHKAQSSGEACQDDIDTYCEGIQVGHGRLEKCLKAHKAKLSSNCKAALGLR